MAVRKSSDLGAALAGLVFGGATLFLLMLLIVWLTNSHFEGKKAHGGGHAAPVQANPTAPVQGAATPPPGTPATGTHAAGSPAEKPPAGTQAPPAGMRTP